MRVAEPSGSGACQWPAWALLLLHAASGIGNQIDQSKLAVYGALNLLYQTYVAIGVTGLELLVQVAMLPYGYNLFLGEAVLRNCILCMSLSWLEGSIGPCTGKDELVRYLGHESNVDYDQYHAWMRMRSKQ